MGPWDSWSELTSYLTDGSLEIDNNGAENQIRPFALGRKNWLIAGSPRGAHASALFYSIFDYLRSIVSPVGWVSVSAIS